MRRIKREDLFRYRFLSGLSVSEDERTAVFCVAQAMRQENGYRRLLWKCSIDTRKAEPIPGTEGVGSFCFLNCDTILFPSLRGEDKKRAETGEFLTVFYELKLDEKEEPVERFRVSLKGAQAVKVRDGLYLLSAVRYNGRPDVESLPEDEKKAMLEKLREEEDFVVCDELPFMSDGRGYINKQRHSLYLYDESSGICSPLTEPFFETSGFAISQDGLCIAYSGVSYDRYFVRTHGIFLYQVDTGQTRQLLAPGSYQIMGLGFWGKQLVVSAAAWNGEGAFPNHDLYTLSLEGGPMKLRYVHRTEDFGGKGCGDCKYGAFTSFQTKGDSLYYLTTSGTSVYVNRWEAGEEPRRLNSKELIPDGLAAAGSHVYVTGSCGGLQEIYRLDGEGGFSAITDVNEEALKDCIVSRPKEFEFTDHDGYTVSGFVMEPAEYDESKRYPGILQIHGGPRASFTPAFFHEYQCLAAEGYFVFYCNPRGSAGRGEMFADIRSRRGCDDYLDVMEWTDFVLNRYPAIDPERLGVAGGSYGGYMTNWIITHTRRFAAAVSMRSIADISGTYGATDYGVWGTPGVYGGTPWANPERLREQSPITYAMNAVTPTLFLHSFEDHRCNLTGAMQLYSALQIKGVPTRMCLFKGECHELSRSGRPRSRIRRLSEISDWFRVYLKPEIDK